MDRDKAIEKIAIHLEFMSRKLKWDALGYTSPHVMPEDYEQVKRDAEKWRRLMALFDTSCDKCFLGHVCGTHRKAEAVCEDIKEAMETNDER